MKKPQRRDHKGPSSTRQPAGPRQSRPDKRDRPRTPGHAAKAAPAKEIKRQGIWIWGTHAVREVLRNPERKIFKILITEAVAKAFESDIKGAEKRLKASLQVTVTERSDIDRLLPQGTVHQGILVDASPLKEVSLDDLLGQSPLPDLLILLDQVTDPHNLGAVLRSAAGFGAGSVIVSERNASGVTGIMAKTACGAVEHVPLITVVNVARTLKTLQEEGYWCIGLAEEGSKDLAQCALSTGRVVLVLGAEGEGLRRLTREHCDELVRLPTQGPIGSLNVSNAAAISLYEVRRQKTDLSTT